MIGICTVGTLRLRSRRYETGDFTMLRKLLLSSAFALACVAPMGAAHAKGYAVLYSFCSQENCTDGLWPYAGVIEDANGNLFGTTGAGGIASCRLYGCGTVFKLAPDGTETVLHAFSASEDGSGPYGGVIADAAGNLYGTTATGGSSGCGGIDYGCGTLFQVQPDGKEKVVYAFGGNNDGAYPLAGVVADRKGNFYGTTSDGGGGTQCIVQFGGCGTVFRVTPRGREKVLYAFTGGSDGANPQAALVIDRAGNLFGTAAYGGNTSACNQGDSPGCGTVFEVMADGTEKTLYAFDGGNDGWAPVASLIEDKDGNLYGATQAGGSTTACNGVGCGIVFEIAPDGTENILYDFTGGGDGAHPSAGLVRDSTGNLYGTTQAGGTSGEGTVFKLASGGKLSVLNTFNGAGDAPVANLLAGAHRTLYGTTEFGSSGTVFKVKK
ncbi:MAG: choice-of-anchor tandem repeat GloVer-containing protein [Rhizomicrobium sp.]